MKYSLLSIATLMTLSLSSSSFTMDTVVSESDGLKTNKRGLTDGITEKRKRGLSSKVVGDEKDSWKGHSSERLQASRFDKSQTSPMLNEANINLILDRKAQVLLKALPIVSNSLEEISNEIGNKVRAMKDHNFNRASEVAVVGSLVLSLRHSTISLLQKLNTPNDSKYSGLPLMVALAINGSGALKAHIMDLITKLESVDDTKTINLKDLKAALEEIGSVTDDIDKGAFILSDGRY